MRNLQLQISSQNNFQSKRHLSSSFRHSFLPFRSGKIEVLVAELLTAELWREKVVPTMVRTSDYRPHSTIPFYLSLYNEAVIGESSFQSTVF